MKQTVNVQPEFHQDELITWHNYEGAKCIPTPGVVVNQQDDECVLIRTRVEGLLKELRVNPKQLAHRQ